MSNNIQRYRDLICEHCWTNTEGIVRSWSRQSKSFEFRMLVGHFALAAADRGCQWCGFVVTTCVDEPVLILPLVKETLAPGIEVKVDASLVWS